MKDLCGFFDYLNRPCGRERESPTHSLRYDARHDYVPSTDVERFARWRELHDVRPDRCPVCNRHAQPCQRCASGECPMAYAHGKDDFRFECRICGWCRQGYPQ